MKAPITSVKHYVQQTQTAATAGSTATLIIAQGKNSADVSNANPQDVVEGSVIKAVFVEYWMLSNEMADAHSAFQFAIIKLTGADIGPSFAEINALHGYENKKNVFLFSQGLIAGDKANPVPVVRQWIKIPKGKQRIGLRDRLAITFGGLTGDVIICGFSTYKEYN